MDAYVKGIVAEYNLKEDMLSVFCLSTKKVVEVFLDGMFSDISCNFIRNEFTGKDAEITGDVSFSSGNLVVWAKELDLYVNRGEVDELNVLSRSIKCGAE